MNNYNKKWVLILAALLLFPLFFWGGPDYQTARSLKYFWNTGHLVFFALTSYFLLHYCKFFVKKTLKVQFIYIVSITLLGGILIELLQSWFSRTPDIGDLIRNVIGSFIGLFFFSSLKKNVSKSRLISIQFLIIVLLLLELIPLAAAIVDEWNAKKKFPVLADFESPLEISRWIGNVDFKIIQDGVDSQNHFLEIELGTSEYSGVFLKYFPCNWKGYSSLTFNIYNPSQNDLYITCRVHDMQHSKGKQLYNDRYNKTFLIKPGKSTINILLDDIFEAPVSRKMNSDNIEEIGIFVIRLKKQTIIYLDDIMLLKEKPESQ